ncbi:MAG: DUF1028 domain-containing protein [Saprospiraceae bacterium]|nr:DUF1028 domain-containing protein [Saprospiraceae bacterium]
MKTNNLLFLIFILIYYSKKIEAQHTFSIVAIDSITGEVGSAGASCLDLTKREYTADIISELFPGLGAINCQASYNRSNQLLAHKRMIKKDNPYEIIKWLTVNDIDQTPEYRQYGIVSNINNIIETAGYSGDSIFGYYNHIIGPNYCIQGNTLLNKSILDSMEYYFLNTEGDLACKLMASLQGANKIGADRRCLDKKRSSLLAFIKIAAPNDIQGKPSIRETIKTSESTNIEPIDQLQKKFNLIHKCD